MSKIGPGGSTSFDMADEKFDMPSGSRTLLANLHPAQTGSAMRSNSQKRKCRTRPGAALARSIKTEVQQFEIVWAKFDMPPTSKFAVSMQGGGL
jgi:hypothetical protein